MRVLVTGASGFIGGVLCEKLLHRGHDVAALVRRPGSEPRGTRPIAGDLSEADGLQPIVSNEPPECVIHLAAEIASQRSERKVREVNVVGTQRLLEACLSLAQPPRIVFSSTVVTGDAGGAVLTEDEPLPVQTPYGRSKQEGEQLILGSGLPAVIIRPSHVYGPGGWYANELVPRLRQPGRFAVIGTGENLWDVVHVDDVAAALILGAETAPSGSVYHVVDDEAVTFGEFMAITARALGTGAPRRIPATLARMVAGGNAVDAVIRSARSSNAKIKRELGWRPRFPSAQEGVADAIARMLDANGRN
jgi:nucleoside-diphosphate-sugar epimerase